MLAVVFLQKRSLKLWLNQYLRFQLLQHLLLYQWGDHLALYLQDDLQLQFLKEGHLLLCHKAALQQHLFNQQHLQHLHYLRADSHLVGLWNSGNITDINGWLAKANSEN